MYEIYIDKHIYKNNYLIHNDNYDELKVNSPQLELELNQVGQLSFNVLPTHPYYNLFIASDTANRFKKMKSIVTVYRNNKLVFRGRILENEEGLFKEKQVVCEGELAFLIDSLIEPYTFTGTPQEALAYYLECHNQKMVDSPEKQFVLGRVSEAIRDGDTTNEDNIISRTNSEYATTWSEINSKLIEKLGGYLLVDSDDSGNRRINWLTEDDFLLSAENIEFGKNLLNIKINVKNDGIITALIPLGAEIGTSTGEETTGEEIKELLTIESLADGIVSTTEEDTIRKKGKYVYSERAVAEYGWIEGVNKWDDITENASLLLEASIKHLNNIKNAIESIEVQAVDGAYEIGTKIKVISPVHGLNGENFPITKKSINLTNPSANVLTLTKTERSFTETSSKINKAQSEISGIVERVENVENNSSGLEERVNANSTAITQTVEQLTSAINQTSEGIITEVAEKYSLKDETNTLISEVRTQIEQTNNEVEIRFTETSQNMNNYQSGVNAQFTEINKYIRFKDGNIILGEEGNELVLKIQNDRISFLENNVEVAYLSNRKLYVLDGEFLNTLRLGNFAFLPRTNGNVSFKKVT